MRAKPGEKLLSKLVQQEKTAKATLARIEGQRRDARDKVTGKTKALAYVRKWLEKLTATELRRECEIRGFLYENMETMEQAMDMVVVAMFSGVVVEEAMTSMPMGPVTHQMSPEDREDGAAKRNERQMEMPFAPI